MILSNLNADIARAKESELMHIWLVVICVVAILALGIALIFYRPVGRSSLCIWGFWPRIDIRVDGQVNLPVFGTQDYRRGSRR